jgi:membrane protease YdiL (CAAX protease family)
VRAAVGSAARGVARGTDARLAWMVVGAGTLLLLARPFAGASPETRTLLFAASYATIAAAALAVPDHGRTVAIGWPLAVGLVALVAAALAVGPPVPTPFASAALPLALLAAVAEEALFRRVAFARLERFGPAIAIVGSALLFALVHLPAYGTAALPLDLGAGVLFGWQRWASGAWTIPAATHAFANLVAVLR